MTRYLCLSVIIPVLFVAALLLGGCSDDNCSGPYCCVPDPTLANIWPNEDGTWWTYEYQSLLTDVIGLTVYEKEEDVPPAPSMWELERLLRTTAPGDTGEYEAGVYALIFDGLTTTNSGVTAQNLNESLGHVGGPNPSSHAEVVSDPLLSRLLVARPDLLDRAMTGGASGGVAQEVVPEPFGEGGGKASTVVRRFSVRFLAEPVLIHGGAWEKSTEWIGTYGDIDTLLAWKFLEADLSPGHEFTHQLVPSLANDVRLQLRILRRRPFRTGAGVFGKALECLYRIDYGISEIFSPEIEGIGYARAFGYGVVVYAPTFGPIYCHERPIVDASDPTGFGIGHITVDLIGTSLLPD